MTGLKLLADQVDAKMMSRAVPGHAASIGISGALSYVLGDLIANEFGWRLAFASGWGVAFLAFVAASSGAAGDLLSPTVVITVLGLLGALTSVVGNEASMRFGRRQLVAAAMILSILIGALIGFIGSTGYRIAVGLVIVYGMIIWLDSSSLTAGAADPTRRGATLAVHSMLGYAGGFVGPLAIGWTLDLPGGMSPVAWGLAFAVIAVLMALALAVFVILRPRDLEGDRNR
jgi:MFS family permease